MTSSRWEINSSATLPIPCPKCGHKQSVLVSKLRQNPKLTCSSCTSEFVDDGAQLDALVKVFERLKRSSPDFSRWRVHRGSE